MKKLSTILGLAILNFITLSEVTSLIRQQSDVAVFAGIVVAILAVYIDYIVIKYISKKTETK